MRSKLLISWTWIIRVTSGLSAPLDFEAINLCSWEYQYVFDLDSTNTISL
jgi:hypothetical protein